MALNAAENVGSGGGGTVAHCESFGAVQRSSSTRWEVASHPMIRSRSDSLPLCIPLRRPVTLHPHPESVLAIL